MRKQDKMYYKKVLNSKLRTKSEVENIKCQFKLCPCVHVLLGCFEKVN